MKTLDRVAELLSLGLSPLGSLDPSDDVAVTSFVAQLGWTLPSVPASIRAALTAARDIAVALPTIHATRWRHATGQADESDVDESTADLLVDVLDLVTQVAALPTTLVGQLPQAYLDATRIGDDFRARFLSWVVTRALDVYHLRARALFEALGVMVLTNEPAIPANHQPPYTKTTLRWDRLQTMLTDPRSWLTDLFGWTTSAVNVQALMDATIAISNRGLQSVYVVYPSDAVSTARVPGVVIPDTVGPDAEAWYPVIKTATWTAYFILGVVPKLTPTEPQGIFAAASWTGAVDGEWKVAPDLYVALEGVAAAAHGIDVIIRPTGAIGVVTNVGATPGSLASGRAAARIIYRRGGREPLVALSRKSYLDVGEVSLGVSVEKPTGGQPDASVELRLVSGTVRFEEEEGSFLSYLLPAQPFEGKFDLELRWSTRTGLTVRGSGDLSARVPVHVEVGPATLHGLELGIRTDDDGFVAETSANVGVKLGPVQLELKRLGLETRLDPGAGNFGIADLDVGFKWPIGIGVAVETTSVTGGGFIAYDDATGRYSGALQLVFEDIRVNALGILDTRPPGGGYSFVGVITAEFEPIQLGLGFTLNGVGGLIGLNRRVDKQALKAALAGGKMADLFFAPDPVAKANELLTSMGEYFPAAEGRYVFGPAAKLGWLGLVTADVAVLLEVPEPVRVVVLGTVDAALPSPSDRVVRIIADVLGFIELEEQRFELEAKLGPESRVLTATLEGGLALRVDWGERPDFILSIGGFHPDYVVPAGFPTPKRLKIPIGSGSDPRLDLTGFLALTTNTAQVGAKVDFYASAGFGLSVDGDIGFEALFIFDPFSFKAKFYGHVALKRNGSTLASVSVDATLTGPRPWHAWGEACLVIDWFPDLCVGFDVEFGSAGGAAATGSDPEPELRAAIQQVKYWSESSPPGVVRVIKAAPPEGAAEATYFDPSSRLTLRQNVVPLNRVVEKYGGGLMPAPATYALGVVELNDAPQAVTKEQAYFAPYQYQELTEEERLSRESFEFMDAGFSIAPAATGSPTALVRDLSYETKIIENVWTRRTAAPHLPGLGEQAAGVRQGVAAIAPLRTSGPKKFTRPPTTPPLVGIDPEDFVIVTSDTLVDSNLIPATTRGAALDAHTSSRSTRRTKTTKVGSVPTYQR